MYRQWVNDIQFRAVLDEVFFIILSKKQRFYFFLGFLLKALLFTFSPTVIWREKIMIWLPHQKTKEIKFNFYFKGKYSNQVTKILK